MKEKITEEISFKDMNFRGCVNRARFNTQFILSLRRKAVLDHADLVPKKNDISYVNYIFGCKACKTNGAVFVEIQLTGSSDVDKDIAGVMAISSETQSGPLMCGEVFVCPRIRE